MASTTNVHALRARLFATALCAMSLATIATPASAGDHKIVIETQALGKALTALAEQADATIFARAALVEGRMAPAVAGDLSVEAALNALLAGSGLTYRRNQDGSYVIVKAAAPSAAPLRKGASDEEGAQETVIVTGSHIGRNAGEISTPISTLSQSDIAASGAIVIEDILRSQPQYSGGYTSHSNNPGTGASELDLRGLGPHRNLVLVNGRRYVFFESDMVTDINVIPPALIERVETVTGGSSAVYGSDAIAGVTNFILRDDFDGLEAKAQVSGATRGDGTTGSFDLTWGRNFDGGRGNIELYGNYYKRTGVRQSERGYSSLALADGTGPDGKPALVSKGSLNSPNGSFAGIAYGSQLNPANMAGLKSALMAAGIGNIGSAGFTFDGAGSPARAFADPADRYNTATLNYLQIPAKRYGVSGFAHYDVSPALTVYGEMAYYHNEVDMQLAEANIATSMTFNADNPYVSAPMREVFHQLDLLDSGAGKNDGRISLRVSRRFTEVGPRHALSRRESYHAGFGLKGDLGDLGETFFHNVHYDISYFYNRANSAVHLNNMVSRSVLMSGILREASGADPLINLFGVGGISKDAADKLRIDTSNPAKTSLKTASALLTGDVAPLPAGPLQASLGIEWRSSHAISTPDAALASGDAVGFDSYSPTEGRVDVFEAFGEVRAPLLAPDSPVGRTAINAAFRYSDYDLRVASGVWTYMGGIEWEPVKGFGFNGQWQHAVRAPNVGELYGGEWADRPIATDPCAKPAAASDAALRALCVATGVPAGLVGDPMVQPDSRVDVLYGANPDLNVESSNTYTIGVNYTPTFLPEMTFSADYFNITLKDAISTLAGGVGSILNLCYSVIRNPGSDVCQAIRRDPTTGIIAAPHSILATYTNIGAIKTSGIDFALSWSRTLPFGLFSGDSNLALDGRATWLNKYAYTPVQDLPDQVNTCTGSFGVTCGDPRPNWKSVGRLVWTTGDLTLNLQHRHMSSVTDDKILVPLRQGLSAPAYASMAAPVMGGRDYIDLSFSYELTDTGLSFYSGVNNLFDVMPPMVGGSQQQANTYPSTYDALGSEYFFAVKAHF